MGKKRIKELKKQIKEAKNTLKELEAKKEQEVAKAQHKVINKLDEMIEEETMQKEGFGQLVGEFFAEVKKLFGKK